MFIIVRLCFYGISGECPIQSGCKRRSKSEAGGGVKVKHLRRQYPRLAGGIQVYCWDLGAGPFVPSPRGGELFWFLAVLRFVRFLASLRR